MPELISAAIAAIHFVVIAIDLAGAIAVFSNRFEVIRLLRWQQIYLGIVFGKSLSLIFLDACPLTITENVFRRMGDLDKAYSESFVSHYLPGLPDKIDLLMTFLLMLAGLVAVLRVAHYQLKSCFAEQSPRTDH